MPDIYILEISSDYSREEIAGAFLDVPGNTLHCESDDELEIYLSDEQVLAVIKRPFREDHPPLAEGIGSPEWSVAYKAILYPNRNDQRLLSGMKDVLENLARHNDGSFVFSYQLDFSYVYFHCGKLIINIDF